MSMCILVTERGFARSPCSGGVIEMPDSADKVMCYNCNAVGTLHANDMKEYELPNQEWRLKQERRAIEEAMTQQEFRMRMELESWQQQQAPDARLRQMEVLAEQRVQHVEQQAQLAVQASMAPYQQLRRAEMAPHQKLMHVEQLAENAVQQARSETQGAQQAQFQMLPPGTPTPALDTPRNRVARTPVLSLPGP